MKVWWERFWAKVDIGDCWQWLGSVNNRGYGTFGAEGKTRYVHRLIWETLVGPIEDGLTLDHLCQNKRCVNPDHLEPVDRVTNWRRAVHVNTRKQFCPKGHPLVWMRKQRACVECEREYHRDYMRQWVPPAQRSQA